MIYIIVEQEEYVEHVFLVGLLACWLLAVVFVVKDLIINSPFV